MWPFKKKNDSPDQSKKEIAKDKIKPEAKVQLTFDEEKMKLMVKPLVPEAPKSDEPETPKPGVKLECPFCKQLIEKYSRRGKCPLCKNWVYYFNGGLYSQEESQRIKSEFYERRFHNRVAGKTSTDLGISDEMIQEREKELTTKFRKTPSRASVFMSLFNESILKVKDLREKEQQYMDAARTLVHMGEDSFHLQKAAALSRLAALKKEKYTSVSITSNNECDACRDLDGEVMTIEEAKKTMPIPIKEGCTNRGKDDKYSICICSYEGEADDEYLKKIINE